jgi:hypothetical protein
VEKRADQGSTPEACVLRWGGIVQALPSRGGVQGIHHLTLLCLTFA